MITDIKEGQELYYVRAHGPENIHKVLVEKIEDDTLHIKFSDNHTYTLSKKQSKALKRYHHDAESAIKHAKEALINEYESWLDRHQELHQEKLMRLETGETISAWNDFHSK